MARFDPSTAKLLPANAQHSYQISSDQLPLSCPLSGMHLWNSHPRVMLTLDDSGRASCYYCGAQYTLKV